MRRHFWRGATVAGEAVFAVLLGVLAVVMGFTDSGLAAGIFAACSVLFAGSAALLWFDRS